MRHQKAGLKLNRTSSHRIAMFRNMVTSLFKHERIRTTTAKAKELRRWAERLITLAKRGGLHARRQALAIIREKAVVHKLFEVADQRYGAVSGGYTRITKLGRRPGDAAPISLIELLVVEKDKPKKKKVTKTKAKATPQKEPELKKKAEAAVEEAEPVAPKKKTVKKKAETAEKKPAKKKDETVAKAKPAARKETKPVTEKADKPAAPRKRTVKKKAEAPEKKVTRKKEKGESAAKPAAGKKAKQEEKKAESEPTKKTPAKKITPKTKEKE
jgi:large subunit ribosomal protein L17